MPIYEYRCQSCGRRTQVFFRSFAAAENSAVGPACSHCAAGDLVRTPSRVAQVRSESGQTDYFSDPTNFADVDYTNPRAMAEWARRMGDAAGVDMGDDYQEMVEELAAGDELGADGPGAMDDFGDL